MGSISSSQVAPPNERAEDAVSEEEETQNGTVEVCGENAQQDGELTRLENRDNSSVEIYGETPEEKVIRLEKTLENERREKWKAIEESERIRVDAVNLEREKNEEIRILEKKLKGDRKEGTSRKEEMDSFKADLMAKRELRQKALAAVSAEMQSLRDELEAEKQLRLVLQNRVESQHSERETHRENVELKREVVLQTQRAKRLLSENDRLKTEMHAGRAELQSRDVRIAQLETEYSEERRSHERTKREMSDVEQDREKKVRMLKEAEEARERMWEDYDREKIEVNRRTTALKDVVEISRQMLLIRENQVQELKKKLKEIEESVNNSKLPDHSSLREEYEKQLENIKALKELYEERVRLMELEKEKLNNTIAQQTKTIEGQEVEVESLKKKWEAASDELKQEKFQKDNLERDLRLSVAKSKDLENEVALINNLFTQMLLGPYNTGNETDLDKLTDLLQENHDLIKEMTLRENSSEIASALPKLLLDLITQVDQENQTEEVDTISEKSDSIAEGAVLPILSYKRAIVFEDAVVEEPKKKEVQHRSDMNPAVQEIASNLPKVWRVLMELLSHHTVPDGPPPGDEKQCYKNVETPSGTRSVISVSNTFIRLKDLILEKKALQKELIRLKQLNSHLETRLDDQEKRLSHVQCELHKTWGVVGRMRAQHQQLHNHERILRYELQEKRVMLSELKQELEYCREKWERARQKNDESENQWQKLRREFAERKSHPSSSLNDSGESGFSDEPNESGEEGENFDADRSNTQSPVEQKRETSCSPEEEEGAAAALPVETDSEKARLREARLKRLEDQCQLLVRRVDITTSKSNYLNNRLEELHEQYGNEPGKTEEATTSTERPNRTVEEILNARSERLKRLEEQCQSLVGKVSDTVQKSNDLSSKLEGIHEECVKNETRSRGRSDDVSEAADDTEDED